MNFTPVWSEAAPAEATLPPPRVVHVKTASKDAAYIGRAMPKQGFHQASDWANDYKPASDSDDDRRTAIRLYVVRLLDQPVRAHLHSLAGRDIACWCHPKRCHGDAIVELVALVRFANGACPHCAAPVVSYLNWHEALGMTESWVCTGPKCARRGHRPRATPACLQREAVLL